MITGHFRIMLTGHVFASGINAAAGGSPAKRVSSSNDLKLPKFFCRFFIRRRKSSVRLPPPELLRDGAQLGILRQRVRHLGKDGEKIQQQ